MILVIGFAVQHPEDLQNVGVALIAMELVPCAIKTQDEFPGLVSSPRCCAHVSLHRRSRAGIGTWCSAAWRRSREEAGGGSFTCAWYNIRAHGLTASTGVGDVRITTLLSCSHFSVWGVWLPWPNNAEDFIQCRRGLHAWSSQLSHVGEDTACQ